MHKNHLHIQMVFPDTVCEYLSASRQLSICGEIFRVDMVHDKRKNARTQARKLRVFLNRWLYDNPDTDTPSDSSLSFCPHAVHAPAGFLGFGIRPFDNI